VSGKSGKKPVTYAKTLLRITEKGGVLKKRGCSPLVNVQTGSKFSGSEKIADSRLLKNVDGGLSTDMKIVRAACK